jgi:hypothetical protein
MTELQLKRNSAYQNIISAIAEANADGFIVTVANDPEANGANIISPLSHAQYNQDDIDDKFIFIGVFEMADIDTIFIN